MRNDQRRKKFRIALVVFSLILVAAGLAFVVIELGKRAKITNFEIKTENIACTNNGQINKYLEGLGLNYFSFKKNKIEENLKKKFYCIGEIEIKVFYPNKLVLAAKGREAVFIVAEVSSSFDANPVVNLPESIQVASESTKEAATVKMLSQILGDLKQASGSGIFLADKEGVVFEEAVGGINFPRLSILGIKLKIGDKVPDGAIEKSLFINNKLKEIGAPSDNMVILGDKLVVSSKPRIIFSLKKRLDYQTASLQLILTQAKINPDPPKSGSSNIESIDLRFDKPVIVYVQKKQ